MEILKSILQVGQVLSGLVLIVLVLLHSPKSEGLGAIGGAANVFASQKGAEAALNKITAYTAGAFYLFSFILGYYFH